MNSVKSEAARADVDLEALERANAGAWWRRPFRLVALGGPGFANAALTLGAGSLTAAMVSGVYFGYQLLWVPAVAMGLELFLLAGMARLACQPGFRLIGAQNRRHGILVGTVLTALIGCFAVAMVFNYGQVVLGTHLMESSAALFGGSLPRWGSALIYLGITGGILLFYEYGEQRGVRLVENLLKAAIAVMLLSFAWGLYRVGIDWRAAAQGLLIPWLPPGREGIDLILAKVGAAAGVMCWVFFVTAGRERGWRPQHEKLARFDLFTGMFLPFVLVNILVICLFAGSMAGGTPSAESAPELARALAPALGERYSQFIFYFGFLAVPLSTTVGMSLAAAMAVFEAFKLDRREHRVLWRVLLFLPQLSLLALWVPGIRPIWLVVGLAAVMAVTNNLVAWSLYLLLNDDTLVERKRQPGWFWNGGMAVHIAFLNCAAILYILNRLGWWG